MAYRLRTDEPVGKGLKRVVRKELENAIAQLDRDKPRDDAVHDARKSIKKVRAVLELVNLKKQGGRSIDDLRRAAHMLSPLRDAEAMLESTEALYSRGSQSIPSAARSAVTATLADDKKRIARKSASDRAFVKVVRSLRNVHRASGSWKWKQLHAPDLFDGLRHSYKRTRRRMQNLSQESSSDEFHTWRKRIKTLWYGLRLLEKRASVGRHLVDLKRLETWLGDDHNLAVLGQKIHSRQFARVGPLRRQLTELTSRRRRRLRERSLALGARVFKVAPKEFKREL